MIRGYFSGAYLNQVDAKHRLSVPAPIRETIEARSAAKAVVLAPAEHANCLVGFDLTHFEALERQLETRFQGDWSEARSRLARTLFGLAETLAYDETGRIILSPILLDLGGLSGPALFLGAGTYFELWSPAAILAADGQDPRLLRTVRALLAAKGIAA
ncbi:division/cell wall cluster transcriptional repressor MraZ [Thermaurantiacus sp.]